MKKRFCAVVCVLLCAVLLGACGNGTKNEEASEATVQSAAETTEAAVQGNAASFNMTEQQIGSTLAGVWASQDDFTEKIRFAEDLSFTHYIKADRHAGAAELSGSGMLTFRYEDGFRPEKTYIWVDSLQNANSNTWYMNGSTISVGGMTFIRDKDF